jgi:hypothetical protein
MTDRSAVTGIVYVATHLNRYVEEAFLSADSVKQRCPDLPIALFTDRSDHRVCSFGCFDIVVPLERVQAPFDRWSAGLALKLHGILQTPFDRTLFLDTDTLVRTAELPALFEILDDHDVAMVETSLDDSYARQQSGLPMFNTGVILYRRTPQTWEWLRRWIELSERNFRFALDDPPPLVPIVSHVRDPDMRRRLLGNDQISLVELLSPVVNHVALRVAVLDYAWNHRLSAMPDRQQIAAKILHYPRRPAAEHVATVKAAMRRYYGEQAAAHES